MPLDLAHPDAHASMSRSALTHAESRPFLAALIPTGRLVDGPWIARRTRKFQ